MLKLIRSYFILHILVLIGQEQNRRVVCGRKRTKSTDFVRYSSSYVSAKIWSDLLNTVKNVLLSTFETALKTHFTLANKAFCPTVDCPRLGFEFLDCTRVMNFVIHLFGDSKLLCETVVYLTRLQCGV